MDTHIKLNELAFQNLRNLRLYLNHLTEDRYIEIKEHNELVFHDKKPDIYVEPTLKSLCPIIYFTFNQVFNVTRVVPYELSSRNLSQIRGLHSLMDSASCSVYELIGNIQDDNTEYGAILNEYLEDIEIKLDIIYERNVSYT